MENTSQRNRTILAGLAVLVGLFMLTIAPWLAQISLESVLEKLVVLIEKEPKFTSGIMLFSIFYPLWRAVGFVGGVALLAIAKEIYNGKNWTLPVALFAYAVPSVSGMFMFLPYVSFVKGFPVPMVISWVGLLGFWCTLLLRSTDKTQKWVDFLTYTFIGMLATHAFTIGIGGLRQLMTRPGKPLFDGIQWWIFTLAGEVNWIATVLLMVSIPLLAMRKKTGWWLALIGSLSILLIDVPTQLIRTATLDYLYGSLLAIGTLFCLLFPMFKNRLIDPELPDAG